MTTSDLDRSPEQAAREAGLREVAETLMNIEQAVKRAERARKATAMTIGCDDLSRILDTAAQRLEAARKELTQGAYFSADQPRLF